MAILSSMLPTGRTALEDVLTLHMAGDIEVDWPKGLWICAVRPQDGRRVALGQHPEELTPLSSAIAASTCISGYFSPVTIDGQQFLDGGIQSPTNADLLAADDLDLAIVVSPMSGGGAPFDKVLRHRAQRPRFRLPLLGRDWAIEVLRMKEDRCRRSRPTSRTRSSTGH
jgi:NTE family protein